MRKGKILGAAIVVGGAVGLVLSSPATVQGDGYTEEEINAPAEEDTWTDDANTYETSSDPDERRDAIARILGAADHASYVDGTIDAFAGAPGDPPR